MARIPLRPLARILKARKSGEDPNTIEKANRAQRRQAIDTKAQRESRWRLAFMIGCFGLAYGAIGTKMGMMAHDGVTAPEIAAVEAAAKAQRAAITDRHGRVLAINMPSQALYATPHMMVNPEYAATSLAKIFPDLDRKRLLKDFTGSKKFLWIRRQISYEQMQAVHEIGEPGLLFAERDARLYPNGHVASHILGGTQYDNEGVHSADIVGTAGVEKEFDRWLRDPANGGAPLQLSIDLTAQLAMEEVLAQGIKDMQAKGATAMILDIDTGEVLAMASLPDFDPNNRPLPLVKGDPSDSPLFNRAIQGQYELGSTFKLFPVAQGLDLGLIGPETMIAAKSPFRIGRYAIRDMHNYGDVLSVTDIMVKSSNVGTVNIARKIGPEKQSAFLQSLGFFDPTTIEVAEAPGAKPLVPKRWPEVTAATVAFGHGLAASPMHLAAAYGTIANKGHLVRPTLVHNRSGRIIGKQVLSEKAAHTATDILRQVVTRGTARAANIPGYEIAGKTGTADKAAGRSGYDRKRVISTFAGVFPASKPKYSLVLTLDEPVTIINGMAFRTAGLTAVPVANKLLTRLAPILGMEPILEIPLPTYSGPDQAMVEAMPLPSKAVAATKIR